MPICLQTYCAQCMKYYRNFFTNVLGRLKTSLCLDAWKGFFATEIEYAKDMAMDMIKWPKIKNLRLGYEAAVHFVSNTH